MSNEPCKSEEQDTAFVSKEETMIVFVCSPYAAPSSWERMEHEEHAAAACSFVIGMGHVPFAPHLFFPRFLKEDKIGERALGIECGKRILARCDEIWFFPFEGKLSPGMGIEIAAASDLGKRIRHWQLKTKVELDRLEGAVAQEEARPCE